MSSGAGSASVFSVAQAVTAPLPPELGALPVPPEITGALPPVVITGVDPAPPAPPAVALMPPPCSGALPAALGPTPELGAQEDRDANTTLNPAATMPAGARRGVCERTKRLAIERY